MNKVTKLFLNMIVEPQAKKFCGPLFVMSSSSTPKGTIELSGSFGSISIGRKKLLVTCWHVLEGFKEKHAKNSVLRFGVLFGGKYPVSASLDDLLNMKIDDERCCDPATFDVGDASDLVAAGDLEFFDLNVNRPPKLQLPQSTFTSVKLKLPARGIPSSPGTGSGS